MAKVRKKEVEEKLDAWAELQAKIKKLENGRNKKLEPFLREFNEQTKPFQEDFERKAQPFREKANALAKEINVLLEADRDADGNPKPIIIATDAASAKIERKEGSRVIHAQKFFNFVKDKNEKFWSCFTVLIKEAKKVISEKEIDDLSTKTPTFPFSIEVTKSK